MKTIVFALVLPVAALLAEPVTAPVWKTEVVAQTRAGLDTNPVAAGGATAPILGTDDAAFVAGGVSAALARTGDARGTLRLSYVGETVAYDGWSSEDYTTHRFGVSGQAVRGPWMLSADGSALWVDGSKDTLVALAAGNANATALWRERRAQWQYRLKLLASYEQGPRVVRVSGALLDYDYKTHLVAGRTAFVDRRDLNAGADLGWRQSPRSLWLLGGRVGAQGQDQTALAGGQCDYSSHYTRALAGWEGSVLDNAKVALLAGPEFRHFNGAVDPRVFPERDQQSLWFEASLSAKPTKRLGLAAKGSRWVWLSSTGKSAYTDLCIETTATWMVTAATTLRALGKVQQSDYDPVVRDDWQSLVGAGVTTKLTTHLQLTVDVLWHRGWNAVDGVTDRTFSRALYTVGASYAF